MHDPQEWRPVLRQDHAPLETAVIFDVDGVLLDLTPGEEDAFFVPFERRYGLTGLSRDWDSYRVRNDEAIVAEILASHDLPEQHHVDVTADYLAVLSKGLREGTLRPTRIAGAGPPWSGCPQSAVT